MSIRTHLNGIGNINVTNRLKGLVDLGREQVKEGLGGALIGQVPENFGNFDLVDAPLEAAVENILTGDFENVLQGVVELFSVNDPDNDGMFLWEIIEPFMGLAPLSGLSDLKSGEVFSSIDESDFSSMFNLDLFGLSGILGDVQNAEDLVGTGITTIIREQEFIEVLMGLEESVVDLIFDDGLGLLQQLAHVLIMERLTDNIPLLETLRSGAGQILSIVVPVDKLEILSEVREFLPFLFEELTALDRIIGLIESKIEAKTGESAGIKTTRKQTLGLLQYASKIAPTGQCTCETGHCRHHQLDILEEMLPEMLPENIIDKVGSKLDIKEVLLTSPLAEAAEFLEKVVSAIPEGFVTKLQLISGILDPVSIISLFAAAVSQVPLVGDDLPQVFNAKVGAKEAIVQIIRSESISVTTLMELVEGYQVIKIPELGSFIAMKGGFLTDSIDTGLNDVLKKGELFSLLNELDSAQLFDFELFSGINEIKFDLSGGRKEVLTLEGFPGGIDMFAGLLGDLSMITEAFGSIVEVLDLPETFDVAMFIEQVIGLLGR